MKNNEKQPSTMGYPHLEALIEQPNPDLAGMRAHQKTLESLSKTASSAKDKASAKQATVAYARFFELFDKLLEVRTKLIEQNQKK